MSAVKKHNMDGLVLELLNSNDDLREVDIVVPAPVGGAFVKRLNGFKTSGVPLNLLSSIKPDVTTASTSVSGMNILSTSVVVLRLLLFYEINFINCFLYL